MKKEIKDLWVKALRSREFKQTTGRLFDGSSYCALGVLSLLALLEGQCTYDEDESDGKFDNKSLSLSFNVMNWAGIQDFMVPGKEFLPVFYKGHWLSISILNDSGLTFEEIALEIEKHWEDF